MLSPRLSALHAHYHQHALIYDIGCDHGKLGLSFLNEGPVKGIHLVDPSDLVIEKLRHFIDSYITDPFFKIDIEHKNGQDVVLRPERKLVFIAGMGGKEVKSILSQLRPQLLPDDDVVISPHRDLLPLRKELHASAFSLGKESVVFDEGRFYQILSLNLRGGPKVHPFGEEVFAGETGEAYRQHQLATFTAHRDVQSREYVTYLRNLTQRF